MSLIDTPTVIFMEPGTSIALQESKIHLISAFKYLSPWAVVSLSSRGLQILAVDIHRGLSDRRGGLVGFRQLRDRSKSQIM